MLFTFKTHPLLKMDLPLEGGFISKSFIKPLSPEGSCYCSEHNPVLRIFICWSECFLHSSWIDSLKFQGTLDLKVVPWHWVGSCQNMATCPLLPSADLNRTCQEFSSHSYDIFKLASLLEWLKLFVCHRQQYQNLDKDNEKEQFPPNCFKVFGSRTTKQSGDFLIFFFFFKL